ncbi:MAG: manganese efflux pump MntP family protein [Candidatus Brocadiia bacterium]
MSLFTVIMVAIGLSADAFAVSIAEGITIHEVRMHHIARIAVVFGLFQGLMPILGWSGGLQLKSFVSGAGPWIAFGLLTIIGSKMVIDAIFGTETEGRGRGSRGVRLMLLGVATSLDALAVGVSIALLGTAIWIPATVMGLITAFLSAIAVYAGDRIGTKLGRKAEIVGGVVLLAIAVKTLLQHVM